MAGRYFVGIALLLGVVLSLPVAAAPPPGPTWKQLTVAQRHVLAPLAGEWDKLDPDRRLKWIGVAERYPNLAPEQQQRLQSRMKEWAALSTEEREAAREKFKNLQQLPPSAARR